MTLCARLAPAGGFFASEIPWLRPTGPDAWLRSGLPDTAALEWRARLA